MFIFILLQVDISIFVIRTGEVLIKFNVFKFILVIEFGHKILFSGHILWESDHVWTDYDHFFGEFGHGQFCQINLDIKSFFLDIFRGNLIMFGQILIIFWENLDMGSFVKLIWTRNPFFLDIFCGNLIMFERILIIFSDILDMSRSVKPIWKRNPIFWTGNTFSEFYWPIL